MDPHTEYRWRTYSGRELRRVKVQPSTLGQPPAMAIYQPVMEQTLRDGAARFENVEVRFGQSVTKVEQDAEGVTVTAGENRVRVRYVLACDGGSSATREQLGIALLGDTIETRWVVIDARVKRWWPDRHILTFWSDAKRPVVDIALGIGNHRWEFPLAPHENESDFATKEQLWGLLNSMGVTADDVEIHQHAFYRHHVRKAERWRDGRVFLLGDAAHLMPPWAGQGMQSGIRDAFNLCWKLALVADGLLEGAAAEQLLDSYEIERAPDVAYMTAVTEELGRIIKMQMTAKEKAMAIAANVLEKVGIKLSALPVSVPPALRGGWLGDTPAKDSALGKMPPQPRMCTANGLQGKLDDLIGSGFAIIGDDCDPATLIPSEVRTEWDRLGARYFAVRPVNSNSQSDTDLIDIEGTLLGWMREHRASMIGLRPDRFVCSDQGRGLRPPFTAG